MTGEQALEIAARHCDRAARDYRERENAALKGREHGLIVERFTSKARACEELATAIRGINLAHFAPPAQPAPLTISARLDRVMNELNAVLSALDPVEDSVMCVAQGRLETAYDTVDEAKDLITVDLDAPDVPDLGAEG